MINKTAHIKIRIATQQDANLIALLGRVTFTETFGHLFTDKQVLLDYYDLTFSVDKIEKSIAKANNIYWLAFADRLPVGYAKLKLNSQTEFIKEKSACQLQKIYVLKDFLSMKIGFELQNVLLKKAQEKSFKKIWLSVFVHNERAINFYSKNGFMPIGNHDFQIGKDKYDFIALFKQLA
ncbi:hypothetical protein DNU06_12025 [Putridiphycobacter roseus]|uniref:N-acetyltransferase domain-containing protein n=1 Tax=Putridiphycobacter roseus TaxID=2219161 RepID=A0A2W1NBA4_9FLAO|nr:GNAT family N-acetyltransferase [Putridiphycobacter roseus]PZE16575.1 hypothetical protein DNU06_12025 [Putridiphycobacter roseus]